VDIDADGDQDVFIGEGEGNVKFYQNTGSASNMTLSERTGASNPLAAVYGTYETLGPYAAPFFVDIDGDGDQVSSSLLALKTGRLRSTCLLRPACRLP